VRYPSRPSAQPAPPVPGPELSASPDARAAPSDRSSLAAAEYRVGRSLRELAELTGRTRTAVRRALGQYRGRGWGVTKPEVAPLAAPREPWVPRGGHPLTPAGGQAGSSGCVSMGDGGPGALPRLDRAIGEPAPRAVHSCLPQHTGWGGAGRDKLPGLAVGCPGGHGMTRYRDGVHAENSPYVRWWFESSLRDRERSLHP
jgi:hypothetical protein